MNNKRLFLEQGEKYSDKKEHYFMVPNWIVDEGKYLELDVYERMAFIYMIRLVNKKDNTTGKGDMFFLAAEQLANCCNYSIGKAKKVLKRLQELGYINKIKTGSNLTGKANVYKMMNLQPNYVDGIEVEINSLRFILEEDEFYELEFKCKGIAYYYPTRELYCYRKRLPELVDVKTGEVN